MHIEFQQTMYGNWMHQKGHHKLHRITIEISHPFMGIKVQSKTHFCSHKLEQSKKLVHKAMLQNLICSPSYLATLSSSQYYCSYQLETNMKIVAFTRTPYSSSERTFVIQGDEFQEQELVCNRSQVSPSSTTIIYIERISVINNIDEMR